MSDADKILNEVVIDSKEKEFEYYISTKKCPFRTYTDSVTMKYCDPNCMALIRDENFNYSCMRLININYQANNVTLIEFES